MEKEYRTTLVISFTATSTKSYKFVFETACNLTGEPSKNWGGSTAYFYTEKIIIVNSAGYQLMKEKYSDNGLTELNATLTAGETYYIIQEIVLESKSTDVKVTVS